MAAKSGGCFPPGSTVQTEDGRRVTMDRLTVGERVLALDAGTGRGRPVYSPVVAFIHRSDDELARFLTITTDAGSRVQLTASHLIYAAAASGDTSASKFQDDVVITKYNDDDDDDIVIIERSFPVFADRVAVGDYVLVARRQNSDGRRRQWKLSSNDGGNGTAEAATVVRPERVIAVTNDDDAHRRPGVYAPLTATGTIVVDNVAASCYALVGSHALAQWTMAPVRWWSTYFDGVTNFAMTSSLRTGTTTTTTHWYAELLQAVGRFVLPGELLFRNGAAESV